MPLLRVQQIDYQKGNLHLLRNIDFSLSKGEIVGLLGVNGAGKSTTLKIIAGILTPSNGVIDYSNKPSIGYVPETPPLIPAWSVSRFLCHLCDLHGIPSAKQHIAISQTVKLLDLEPVLNKTCTQLSKGNQQRLNIAQALLHQPDLLVLDEPTSGLDPQQISAFRQLLLHLKSNTSIILSSHIMQEITRLCDRAIVIHQGNQVGEIGLKARKDCFLIEFTEPVAKKVFAYCSKWRDGDNIRHQFILDKNGTANSALAFCLAKQLPIGRVIGMEDAIEQEFLSMTGRA